MTVGATSKPELSRKKLDALIRRLGEKRSPAAASPSADAIPRRPAASPCPLSFAQQRLWFLDRLQPGSAAYNVPGTLRLRGPLDAAALTRSLNEIVRRHEALRTSFTVTGGEVVQVVAPESAPFFTRVDLGGPGEGPDAARQREVSRLTESEARRPFDLARGPVLRAVLMRLAPDEHLLLVVMHHIVADGWSVGLFVRQLGELYEAFLSAAPSPLAELEIQYGDFAAWQRGDESLETHLAYWRGHLGGVSPLELPADRPRAAVRDRRAATVERLLVSRRAVRQLEGLGQEQGATLFMTLLAAFQVLLHRYTGQDDIAVGTPIAGRTRPEIEGLIGCFVNTLVLRADLGSDPSFSELLGQVKELTLAAYEHQAVPFEKLVEELQPERRLFTTPLFQVMLALQDELPPRRRLGGLETELQELANGTAKFELTLFLTPTAEGLRGSFEYDRDVFEAATVARFAGHFSNLLEHIASGAPTASRLSRLPILSPRERRQLVEAGRAAAAVQAFEGVHRGFEAQTERTPDAVAVVSDEASLTYRELDQAANRLAHQLMELGVRAENPVGVMIERSLSMVTAVLAVVKAGAAYVPLDPSYPDERLAFMVSDFGSGRQAPILLTHTALVGRCERFGRAARLLCVDGEAESRAIAARSAARPAAAVGPGNAVYVIYTSGSTGRPKGVVVTHRGLTNYLSWGLDFYGVERGQGAPLASSLAFDLTVTSLFTPLLAGRSVFLVPEERGLGALARTLAARSDLSLLKLTPTHLELLGHLLAEGGDVAGPGVLILGGEALSAEHLAFWRAAMPRTRLINEYGPTETVVGCTLYEVASGDGASGPVPIGRPMAGARVYLLDRRLELVPPGAHGELCVGGPGVARGYFGRPALTAELFVPDPLAAEGGRRLYRTGDLARRRSDGELDYLGRIDHQVKLRGYRIELGEIEAAIVAEAAVREAAVLLRDGPGGPRLMAYVMPAASGPTPEEDLRRSLAARLPEYMVPELFVTLEELPTSPNGKIDRAALGALRLPSAARPASPAPRSGLEREIAAVWQDVLGRGEVGLSDNFFDLGGHSLLLVRVHSELRDRLDLELPLTQLFEYPTIASLAESLRGVETAAADPGVTRAERRRARRATADAAPEADAGGVAILATAGRFPGAADPESLWRNLRDGVESIRRFSPAELLADGVPQSLVEHPDYVPAAGVVDEADLFDADFFDLSPREAEITDPQQRLFLECAWEALERAGYGHEDYRGAVGLFAGGSFSTYLLGLLPYLDLAIGDMQALIGNDKDFLTTRVAYKLNLKGPTLTVQTACSSSLVAVHMACQSLLAGECDMALAGGVSVRVPLASGYLFEEQGIVSPDGHCRAFDAGAQGTVPGSGLGVVVLKELAGALADGDPVLAVIRGSAVNNDGSAKVGYTAPSVEGQAAALTEARSMAGFRPETVGYVETHGTGTRLGDPIEIAALKKSYGGAGGGGSCALGSVKTNIGHLDAAAGIAGLIKTVEALRHAQLPPSLHFERPNAEIDFDDSPFYVNAALADWPRGETPRRAGVSSFGIGGSNAHVMLEEAPAAAASDSSAPWQLLVLSARTETALEQATDQLAKTLGQRSGQLEAADVAYTLRLGRQPLEHRRAVVCKDLEDAAAILSERHPRRLLSGAVAPRPPSLVFLFPGQGAQRVNMGRGLYETEGVFRDQVDRSARILEAHLGLDLRSLLYPAAEETVRARQALRRTELTQPALFVVEQALARLWIERVGRPAAMIGHSLGEYVAACVAGVFSLEEALALVAERARLMAAMPAGAMLAVPLSEAEVAPLLGADLSLAAINGARRVVVSGPDGAVAALEEKLAAADVEARRLETSHAFHSAMMEGVLEPFAERLGRVALTEPAIPWVSNLTGTWITPAEATDPGYWVSHLRRPVRLADGLDRLLENEDALFVELGPGRTLASAVQRQAAKRRTALVALGDTKRDGSGAAEADVAAWLAAVGQAWLRGCPVDWPAWHAGERRRRVTLPTYPFERRRYWMGAGPAVPEGRPVAEPAALALHPRPQLAESYAAPRSELERILVECWQDLLGIESIGIHDSFFELGGDSLLATQVVSRLRDDLGVTLELSDFFEASTVAELAALEAFEEAAGTAAPPIPRLDRLGELPLSFAQERLWVLDQMTPESPAYNVTTGVRIGGRLDMSLFRAAFAELVRRHETLRTRFTSHGGRPVQVVEPAVELAVPLADLSALGAAARRAERERQTAAEARRPFALGRAPLLRLHVLRLAGDEHLALFTLHHIVTDGWSMGILVRELGELYAAAAEGRPSPLAELAVQYADFAAWQRQWLDSRSTDGSLLERQLGYWREHLSGAPALLELPTDRPRPAVRRERGATLPVAVPAALSRALEELSQHRDTTLFMTLLAAFAALMGRHSGQHDVVVGSPIANRRRTEIEGLIGFFVNTLALRLDLAGDPGAAALVSRTRETTLAAYAHQDVPFEKLVEELEIGRDLSRTPIFQVMMVLQNAPHGVLELPGLELEPFEVPTGTAKFDLTLTLAETPAGLAGFLEYDRDLFDTVTVRRLLGHFVTLLRGFSSAPEAPVSRLPVLDAAQRAQLVREWNDVAEPAPRPSEDREPVHRLVAARAARAPETPAVVAGDEVLSYGELDGRADRLARVLRSRGVGPEVLVGVFMERSPEMLVGLLGTLKAGGAYVALDPAAPADRLAYQLADAGVAVVLTQERLLPSLGEMETCVICLDRPDREAGPQVRAGREAGPDNLAYVIYTSGSTGRPKGTELSHSGLSNLVAWHQRQYAVTAADRVTHLASPGFDASVWEIWPNLAAGAAIHIPPPEWVTDPERLLGWLADNGITWSFMPTPLAEAVLEQPMPAALALRTLLTGGDRLHQAPDPGSPFELINLYGPTENTVVTTAGRVAAAAAGVPSIGRPIGGNRVYLLDRRRQPVPIGVAGELVIGGRGLARGYLGRPSLTAESFVPDAVSRAPGARLYLSGDLSRYLPDGTIDFLGRIDNQVKIRGFRIEPGEVEAVLAELDAVREAAVVVRDDAPGRGEPGEGSGRALVAYVVAHDEDPIALPELRRLLQDRLPGYMVPAAFVVLDALPLSTSGKVDRRALPPPPWRDESREAAAPRTYMEELVAGIWADVLGIEEVSIHDDFFEFGGHSLLATQVASRVSEACGVEIGLRRLFEAPTVAAFAATVEKARAAALPPLDRVSREDALAASFAQERLWFLDQLQPDSAAYNIAAALRLRGPFEVAAFTAAFEALARRHETLRTGFTSAQDRPCQYVAPRLELTIPIVDLSGLAAGVREVEMRQVLAGAARRPFDLTAPPLWNVLLARMEDAEPERRDYVVFIAMHHIISDGWSMAVLTRELAGFYRAALAGEPSPLAELPAQYADFAAWQRRWLTGDLLERRLAHWRENLAGAPALLELPTDRPRPAVRRQLGATIPVALPSALSRALGELSQRHGATLYMTLLAAFTALLGRYSGQRDVVVGTPIANRRHSAVERMIGFFVNTLALRVDLGGDPEFRRLLRRTREVTLAAYAHQDVPFERLVGEIETRRDPSRTPLFQVMLALQNAPLGALELPELERESIEVGTATAKFDLTLVLTETPAGLVGLLEYDSDLFDRTRGVRLVKHFENILREIADVPEKHLAELGLLGSGERHQLLAEWSDTATGYPHSSTVPELFAARAAAAPDAVALRTAELAVTYGELARRARRLAVALRRLGVGPEVPVGLCLTRSPRMVTATLAVLEAGGLYVPLDPEYPAERLALILEDAGASVLLVEDALRGILPHSLPGIRVVSFDAVAMAAGDGLPPPVGAAADNLAYVMYTSGSTGRPKGVAVTHGNIVRLVCGTDYVRVEPRDRVGQAANISFDAATFEIWGALLNGASIVFVTKEVALSPRLVDEIRRQGINTLFLTTALFNLLAREKVPFATLRHLMFGGEAVDPASVREVLGGEPPENLLHVYGPTESTTFTTWQRVTEVPAGAATVAIGRAIANTRVHVLDRHLDPAPIGVPGELLIGGDGLARGYLDRPRLTAERFVPDACGATSGGRLYASGDLVRHVAGGAIEFLGRFDDQVKIRGFRIEPGEVETVLGKQPAVREAAVVVRDDAPGGDRCLVAYVSATDGASASPAELRGALEQKLPDYMVPVAIMVLDALPLNPNGKVDRNALPAPAWSVADDYVAPRTPVEELVAGIWAELLGHDERIGVHDDFFELGGHSLLATQVVSRLRKSLDVEVPLAKLFTAPTVAGLAMMVDESRRAALPAAPPLTACERGDRAVASFAQERLWLIDRLQPGKATYNVPLTVRLVGELDEAALRAALAEVVRRHETLRTTFTEGVGHALQVIHPRFEIACPGIDLRALPAHQRQRRMWDLAGTEALRPFDLEAGPLLSMALVYLSEREHVLVLNMHHVISDGWSLEVLIREVAALYDAFRDGRPSPLPELAIQYADFANWQRAWLAGEVLDTQLAYWRRQLAGAPTVLELPTDRPRPMTRSWRGTQLPVAIPAAESAGLAALSQQQGTTLFMTLLAAFQTLLCRYTGQLDVTVGSPVANRNRVETEGLIGFFVNTLVLRGRFGGDPTFQELLAQTREVSLAAYDNQDLPFEKLVEELEPNRQLNTSPLFQVMFVLQNTPAAPLELPGLRVDPLEVANDTVKFDLTLSLIGAEDGLRGSLEYDRELFDRVTIRRLSGHYLTLLRGLVEAPRGRVSAAPLLAAAECAQLVREWNDAVAPSLRSASRQPCLHELFEAQALRTPDAVAMTFEPETGPPRQLSYRELEARAEELARHLRCRGVGLEARVGIFMDRCPELVVGLLGVLKAGGAYLPLDPEYPPKRLAFMLEDARTDVVLTQARLLAALPENGAEKICLDRARQPAPQQGPEGVSRVHRTVGGNAAYVIYTSGSTGRPKGVMIPHAAIVNHMSWMQRALPLTQRDAVLQKTPLGFDASVWEFFLPLMSGARLVLARRGGHKDPAYLVAEITTRDVTVMQVVPSLLRSLLEEPGLAGCGQLRRIFAGGEALPAEYGSRLAELLDAELFNLYGPTEASIDTTYAALEPGHFQPGVASIGRPIDDVRLYVLDAQLRAVPAGVAGELLIGGAGLARGYWQRPALTAEKFVPDAWGARPGERLYRSGDLVRYRHDGTLDFLGRIDHQVKVRGFRIELGEIEAALRDLPAVREAAVRAWDERLVAYATAHPDEELDADELRDSLRAQLPDYMVPAAFVVLEALPLTPNGKVDRLALPAPEWKSGDQVAPRTAVEEMIAGIFSQVLNLGEAERLGVNDDFFALGGHSLLATQVMSRVRQSFGVDLKLRRLFAGPTVAELAREVAAARNDGSVAEAPPIERRPRAGERRGLRLSFAQERLWFIDQLQPGQATYNVPAAVRLAGKLDAGALEAALAEVARRHEVLRTTFAETDGRPVQVVHARLELRLPTVDLTALAAGRRERHLRELARSAAGEPFDLRAGPLLRATLLRLAAGTPDGGEHVLLLNQHHIVSDGWSVEILIREVAALYTAFRDGRPSPLAELAIQYADFAHWQREWLEGEVLETQHAYWRRQFAEAPAVLELPTDRPRPATRSWRGAQSPVAIPAAVDAGLRALSRRQGATLFMTLLAAFQALLSRYTGQPDVAVGSPVANRNRLETEGLIGFFVNTLVLRTRLGGEATFEELLARVREVALQAYDHQDLPFEKLVEEIEPQRQLNTTPLFQVMFVLQNTPQAPLVLPDLRLEPLEVASAAAKFDLTLSLTDSEDGLCGSLEYDRDLFDGTTVRRMVSHLGTLLRGVVARPRARLAELELLSRAERAQTLVEWNERDWSAPSASRQPCLHELFEAQALRTPDAVAVVFGPEEGHPGQHLSYRELDEAANRLARHLDSLGVGADDRVGVLTERSCEMVIELLAILKAGGAYVPLDSSYPEERLIFMLRDFTRGLAAPVLLVRKAVLENFPGLGAEARALGVQLLDVAAQRPAITARSAAPGDVTAGRGTAADLAAYVIYTSGSTGRPKGVSITHRNVSNQIVWLQRSFALTPGDAFLQKTPLSFDVSVEEIFWPLTAGARLVLARPEGHRDVAYLARRIADEGVTTLNLVPAQLRGLLEQTDVEELRSLRRLICGAEALPPDLVQQFSERCRTVELLNFYGPTETTIQATWWPCDRRARLRQVPIGRPVGNTTAYVLDRTLRPLPAGVAGELHVGGVQLARGYLNRPRLTSEKFVPDPFGPAGSRLYRTGDLARFLPGGDVEYLGRIDSQVKVLGFRIEPGEVESLLARHPQVREAAVVARETGPAASRDMRLVAYVVVTGEPGLEPRELRRFLARELPEYMLPSIFVELEALPLTPSGKLDRRALPEPAGVESGLKTTYVEPRDPIEEVLAGIVAEVLGIDRVGAHDGFFELGGHSLLGTRVIARVRSVFRNDMPLRCLFEAPTVADLATAVRQREVASGQAEKLARLYLRIRSMSAEEVRQRLENQETKS